MHSGFPTTRPLSPTPTRRRTWFSADPFERSKRERESIAGFANASYRWNDLEFAAGLRVDHWDSERENRASGSSDSQDETETLFRGSVSYFLDDDRSMVYALYSQGFEPGDFNLADAVGGVGLFPYGREKATNYEIGYKGRLLDDRVVLTAAVFKLDYKDRQLEFQEVVGGRFIEGIGNAGDSRHWGWEADLQVFLHPDLTFSAAYGYLDAEWKSGTVSQITGAPISGRTPLNASDWSASYALDYDREINADLRLFGRLQVRQKGDAETNARQFEVPGDDFPIWKNDGFTVTDIHVGVGWQNVEVGLTGCGESDWVGRDASDGRRAEQGEGSPFPVRTGSVSHG